MAWLPQAHAHAARDALRELMPLFPYASCVPFGREPDALGRLGLTGAPRRTRRAPSEVLTRIEALLGLDAAQALRYVDNKRGLRRVIALAGRWRGDACASVPACRPNRGRAMVACVARRRSAGARHTGAACCAPAPRHRAPCRRSHPRCTCHNVSEARIRAALASMTGASEARLTQLQQALRCGTECGSCLPALRRLVAEPAIA